MFHNVFISERGPFRIEKYLSAQAGLPSIGKRLTWSRLKEGKPEDGLFRKEGKQKAPSFGKEGAVRDSLFRRLYGAERDGRLSGAAESAVSS